MKLKINNNYLLFACVVILTLLCFNSINSPIRFDKKRTERELAVKKRLIKIRTAEQKYRLKYRAYTGDFGKLIQEGLLADSLQYIPFSDHKKFSLQATTEIGKSGRQIPLMECSASFRDYLDGLDENSINSLIEKANNSGNFPGLKIGDLTTDNNNAGNWE